MERYPLSIFDSSLGVPCDLGASWIHGVKKNPLTRWCRNLGIGIRRIPHGKPRIYKAGESYRLSLGLWRAKHGLNRAVFAYVRAFLSYRPRMGRGQNPADTSLADVAVVTMPVGALRSEEVEFDPPLGRLKQDALNRIGYGGVLNKSAFRFSKRFWPSGHEKMASLPTDGGDRRKLAENPKGTVSFLPVKPRMQRITGRFTALSLPVSGKGGEYIGSTAVITRDGGGSCRGGKKGFQLRDSEHLAGLLLSTGGKKAFCVISWGQDGFSFLPRLPGWSFQQLICRGFLPPPHSLRRAPRFYSGP